MKVKGGEITAVTHSPSGQMVAHVRADDGYEFLMPFGMPCSIADIQRGVEQELSSVDFAKSHAASLHAQIVAVTDQKVVPIQKLTWYHKLWVVVSWYFRRSK